MLVGENAFITKFFNLTQDMLLTQHVQFPTRHRPNQRSSLLDLIFTDDPDKVQDIMNHLPPVGSSDHECLVWSYICYDNFTLNAPALNKFNYPKGDYELMN